MDEWTETDLVQTETLRDSSQNGQPKWPPASKQASQNGLPAAQTSTKRIAVTFKHYSLAKQAKREKFEESQKRTLCITLMPLDVNKEELLDKFKQFGEIEDVVIKSSPLQQCLKAYLRFAFAIILYIIHFNV